MRDDAARLQDILEALERIQKHAQQGPEASDRVDAAEVQAPVERDLPQPKPKVAAMVRKLKKDT
jgi:uncharacterized protein with HEPN domain